VLNFKKLDARNESLAKYLTTLIYACLTRIRYTSYLHLSFLHPMALILAGRDIVSSPQDGMEEHVFKTAAKLLSRVCATCLYTWITIEH
jgi:uncharacterized membrane protein YjjP (DUF1212 family)